MNQPEIHPEATALLGISFTRPADGGTRRDGAKASLEAMPILPDIAKGGDIPFCADMLLEASDAILINVLDRVVRVNKHVSSPAVSALFALELAKTINMQMDALMDSLTGPVAMLSEVEVNKLPPEDQKRIEQKSKANSLRMLAALLGIADGER